MRYYVRGIGLQSMARLGCFLGWLVALIPSLCLGGGLVLVVDRVHAALAQVQPVTITVLGQQLLRLDFLELLQLQSLNATLTPWAQAPVMTFIAVTFVLTLAGALICTATLLLVGLLYNLIARAGLGLELDMKS